MQSGAGEASNFSDAAYAAAGAKVVDAAGAWGADLVTHVRPPSPEEAALLQGRTLCSMIWPAQVAAARASARAIGFSFFLLRLILGCVS